MVLAKGKIAEVYSMSAIVLLYASEGEVEDLGLSLVHDVQY